jgi:hypothetical protein
MFPRSSITANDTLQSKDNPFEFSNEKRSVEEKKCMKSFSGDGIKLIELAVISSL